MSNPARHAEVKIIYQTKDISRDIAPYLINFTFNDNSGDKADDINISLADRDSLWLSDWAPSKGDKIQASIIIHNWDDFSRTESLPCGIYEVDEINYSCPPKIIEIKAVSSQVSKSACGEKHNKAWENVKFSTIAGDLAANNNLKLFYDVADDPFIERREQNELSDLEFLAQTAQNYGLSVKINDDKIIIFDEELYEAKDSITEIKSTDPKVISWRFSTKCAGIYKSSRVRYHHPVKNETFTAQDTDTAAEGTERVLEINERVENQSDANKIAHKRLQQANSREITGTITLLGDLKFLAGVNITCSGFGQFDGKYLIESVTHKLTDGYTCTLNLKMGGESKKTAAGNKTRRQRNKSSSKPASLGYYEGDKHY